MKDIEAHNREAALALQVIHVSLTEGEYNEFNY